MKTLLSCEFNMDAGCVELRYSDGSMISIDCTAVEDEEANSYFQRTELDWLIYNQPMEYAHLVLSANMEQYVQGTQVHRWMYCKEMWHRPPVR